MRGLNLINPNPRVHRVPHRRNYTTQAVMGHRVAPGVTVEMIYGLVKSIKDPEHPYTLEQLKVVSPSQVLVMDGVKKTHIRIEFSPTVPHCSLASLIGLCLREKLNRSLRKPFKLDVFVIKEHASASEVNRQINDKERVAAAMENEYLKAVVEACLADPLPGLGSNVQVPHLVQDIHLQSMDLDEDEMDTVAL
mmetsp:Transcript_134065/g.189451  ORF Transcript_134065/g.189451 Transcript_134065/m.189451 type:complete len:193 (+) Transcript_134065:99-677(+)